MGPERKSLASGAAAVVLALAGPAACGDAGRAQDGTALTSPPEPAPEAGRPTLDQPPKTPAAPAPAAGAAVTLEGEVLSAGAPCPRVRGDDGRLASIQGGGAAPAAYAPGARVRVSGRWIETSFCDGPTIEADAVEFLTADPPA